MTATIITVQNDPAFDPIYDIRFDDSPVCDAEKPLEGGGCICEGFDFLEHAEGYIKRRAAGICGDALERYCIGGYRVNK